MKRFLKKVILYFVVTVTVCFVPSIVIDPFNVFHPLSIRENGVEPNKNYIKTVYILNNKDKFDSYLLGSSHVAVMNVYNMDEKCYNMYYSGAVPEENAATLMTLVENGVIPKKIYLGVDTLSYKDCYDNHISERLRSPYQYSQKNPLDFWMLYLDPVVNLKATKEIISNVGADALKPSIYTDLFYNHGGQFAYGVKTTLNPDVVADEVSESYSYMISWLNENKDNYPDDFKYMKQQLAAVSKIVDICSEYDIELVVFTNPMYFKQFATGVEEEAYLSFLRELSRITPYYNFSGYNIYTTDCNYYYADESHYFCELGDYVLNCINNGVVDEEAYSQGFGMKIDQNNVEILIEIITDDKINW